MTFHYTLRDPTFVFYSAHFIVKDKERETLHGHSYHVELGITSNKQLGAEKIERVKQAVSRVCSELTCKFLLPAKSEHLSVERIEGDNYQVKVWGKATYVFPIQTCLELPLAYSSAEMLAEYIFSRVRREENIADASVTVRVYEKEGQGAHCRL